MFKADINLVVALPAEAKPLLQLFTLQRRQPDQGLPVYTADNVALVVTGPGMAAAAEGVRQLYQQNENPQASWINIGIAGHAAYSLGEAILASKVIDSESKDCWSLPTPQDLPCRLGTVQSVRHPVTDYPGEITYDMEAAGFVSAALEFTGLNQLQVLKIISDNRLHPTKAVNAKVVRKLIHGQFNLISQLTSRMEIDV